MKKTYILAVLLLFLPVYLISQQFDIEKYETAVRPVSLSIHFSEEVISLDHIHLFRMLEKESGQSIVDQYYSLVSGSGFFISNEGHLVTNHHVIDINAVGFEINQYLRSYLEKINEKYGYLFSEDEFIEFAEVVQQVFLEGDIERLVLFPDGRELKLNLVAADDSRDLALLRLKKEERTSQLSFLNNEDTGYVQDVYSIGYPLQGVFNEYFDKIQATVTSGIVSAKRERRLRNRSEVTIGTLQHTASINAGNSGGPLVTESGLVVGVNSSLFSEANNIYLAVSAEEVLTWLEEIGKRGLAESRSYIPIALAEEALEIFEVGITSDPSGSKIYVDDNYVGITPLSTTLYGSREYKITVKKEGFIDADEFVSIANKTGQNFEFVLSRGGRIDFGRGLPSTIQVVARREGDERIFRHNEPVMLPNGKWTVGLEGPVSNGAVEEVYIENDTPLLPLNLFLSTMRVNFPNLLAESEVILLSTAEMLSRGNNRIDLSYDSTELLVRTPTYLDTIFSITPDYQHDTFTIDIDYQRSHEYLYMKGIRWGLPLLISGAVLAGASIALNIDPVAVALSNTYETYSILKYVSFGTLVTGGIVGGIGLFGTIRAVENKDRSDEPRKVEYDFSQTRTENSNEY